MASLGVRESCDSHVAPLLAARLVSQVLDEAFVIARAADESGQPWLYVSMLKNLRSGKLSDTNEITFIASKGDSALNEKNVDDLLNLVATSIPQKVCEVTKLKPDNVFFGQGDEEYDLTELSKLTSMFINHHFDMSDVEQTAVFDNTHTQVVNDAPIDNHLTQAMINIMETYASSAFAMGLDNEPHPNITCQSKTTEQIEEMLKDIEKSASNILADDLNYIAKDNEIDEEFYIEDDVDANKNNNIVIIDDENAEIICAQLQGIPLEVNDIAAKETKKEANGDNFYENAYLTLNRDYDQCSEDHVEQTFEDPKGLPMQEVELDPANTSDDQLSEIEQDKVIKNELMAVSGVSGVSGRSKSSLLSRCRFQTAKLFSCLRSFWIRKTLGKCKKKRSQKLNRRLCPLSSDARRRDQISAPLYHSVL